MEQPVLAQEQDLVFALDIGTRSIIGVVGQVEDGRFRVLALEREEHGKRSMLDGQIEDIEQVARVAQAVTRRLEERCGRTLSRVCVAAAGRALRMERGHFAMELPGTRAVDDETIGHLEAGAVSQAEAQLTREGEQDRRFYLVGYTVTQYLLDRYPMTTLKDHHGRALEAEVVATFLPSEVVESLYTTMRRAGLEVVSLTLEPIAALNAAIPSELRLLNLVLADIGAGTSDIAACREGSVVGYTMATVAGDEITEALMKTYLLDFRTAELLKTKLDGEEEVGFSDILGMEHTVSAQELRMSVAEVSRSLAQEIASRVLEVNGGPPSALFLSGGGSKLAGLRSYMAECLNMDEKRVAVAGNNFHLTAVSTVCELNNPEYATPLGIAVSAALGLVSDSYVVTLNGQTAKLFRSGTLTVMEILMMNGYTYVDLIGRTGQSLAVTLNGERTVLRGEPATPSSLKLNGEAAAPSALVHAGDSIEFIPAKSGQPAPQRLDALLGEDFQGDILVNGVAVGLEYQMYTGDVVQALPQQREPEEEAREEALWEEETWVEEVRDEAPAHPAMGQTPVAEPVPPQEPVPPVTLPPLTLTLNGRPLTLPPKGDGSPHYLMDLLDATGIDFTRLDRPVVLAVNGTPGAFSQEMREGDVVRIGFEE